MAENTRVMLNDEDAEKVTGGGLIISGSEDAPVLEWRDKKYQLIRTFRIVGSPNEVRELLITKYWEFSENQRDQQMITYLGSNGYLAM